jgi:protein phosphatase
MPTIESKTIAGLVYAAGTDVGMRRATNQDAHTILLAPNAEEYAKRGHFFMVADGMGAHAAGELASKLAVDSAPHLYRKHLDLSQPEALQLAVVETNTEINRRGKANLDFHNMGTTASTLVLLPQGALIAQVGDSRIYRIRGSRLDQLTFDHSLLWELRRAGQISDQADEEAIPSNVITRSLGPNERVQVDLEGPFPTEIGDTFLLCSDGLTGRVDDEELGELLANLEPPQACQTLIDLANLRGGPDNITVIIARITGPETATNADVEPLRVGADLEKSEGAHLAFWIVGAVVLLLGLILALAQNWVVAGAAAAGGAAVLLFALIINATRSPSGTEIGRGRMLGGGPHTTTTCAVGVKSIDRLREIVKDLRRISVDENWVVNWKGLEAFEQRAGEAVKSDNLVEAFRQFAAAITFMMEELRMQQKRAADDSSIDY